MTAPFKLKKRYLRLMVEVKKKQQHTALRTTAPHNFGREGRGRGNLPPPLSVTVDGRSEGRKRGGEEEISSAPSKHFNSIFSTQNGL